MPPKIYAIKVIKITERFHGVNSDTLFSFYKNILFFSEPEIFLNSRPMFGDFPLTPTPKYMIKLLLLTCYFISQNFIL